MGLINNLARSDGSTIGAPVNYFSDAFGGFNPFVASGTLLLWLQPGAGTFQDTAGTTPAVANNDPVARWNDQSGNANNVLQVTAGKRPLIKTNALGAFSSILSDAVDDFLIATFALNQPQTYFAVVKQVTWIIGTILVDGNNFLGGAIQESVATPQIIAHAGAAGGLNGNLAVGSFGIAMCLFNGASSILQVNNTAQTTGNFGANGMGGVTFFAQGGGAASFVNAELLEVLVYSGALSAGDQAVIRNGLNAKYAIF